MASFLYGFPRKQSSIDLASSCLLYWSKRRPPERATIGLGSWRQGYLSLKTRRLLNRCWYTKTDPPHWCTKNSSKSVKEVRHYRKDTNVYFGPFLEHLKTVAHGIGVCADGTPVVSIKE